MGARPQAAAARIPDGPPRRPRPCSPLPRRGEHRQTRRGGRRRCLEAGGREKCRRGPARAACRGRDEMTQRCGFVAVVGAPNAGKSTLVNALVGQKVAIVSPKAQTTRTRLMGVAMEGETQIILIDTPGIFAPTRRLDRAMVAAAWSSLEEAEAILVMIDAAAKLTGRVERVLEGIANRPEKKYLILNKVDLTKKDKLLTIATELNAKVQFDETFFIAASSGDGVPDLKAHLAGLMPEGPWHFPEDEVSDAPERMLAAEITREQLYRQLQIGRAHV